VNRSVFDAVRDERPDGGPHKNAGHPAWQDDHAGDQPKPNISPGLKSM
jgi:hypothetical protein